MIRTWEVGSPASSRNQILHLRHAAGGKLEAFFVVDAIFASMYRRVNSCDAAVEAHCGYLQQEKQLLQRAAQSGAETTTTRATTCSAFLTPTASLGCAALTRAFAAVAAAWTTAYTPTQALHELGTYEGVAVQQVASARMATKQSTISRVLKAKVVRAQTRQKEGAEGGDKDTEQTQRRKVLEQAFETVKESYVDGSKIDWNQVQSKMERRQLGSDEQLSASLKWLLSCCNDRFTRYLSAEQLEEVREDMDGEMCGVGISFSRGEGWMGAKRMIVRQVVRRSAGAKAGLMKGDSITAIDMKRVGKLSVEERMSRLMGREGEKVLISFERDGVERSSMVTRERFEVPTVWAERVAVVGVGDVAYVRVGEFGAHTAAQLRREMRRVVKLGAVELFVLDMRGNAGGLVWKAVEVAKMFLEREKVVVRFAYKNGEKWTERTGWRLLGMQMGAGDGTAQKTRPMVVVVDGETASASELVTGALRDNCRAVVVGSRTFGKGSVQAVVGLRNGAGLAVTVAKYGTPRGTDLGDGRGVRPDLEHEDMGSGEDAVRDLFGNGVAKRRMKWIMCELERCERERAS